MAEMKESNNGHKECLMPFYEPFLEGNGHRNGVKPIY
jgi:hypothetical protein